MTVGQLSPEPPEYVDAGLTAEQLVEAHFLRSPRQAYLVVDRGSLVGVVTVSDVSGLSLDERAATRVGQIMRPLQDVAAVDAGQPLVEVVLGMRSGRHDRLLVVRDAGMAGALAAQDVSDWVEQARSAGPRRGR
jgi:CBS domain containing-hemolysin-like protein